MDKERFEEIVNEMPMTIREYPDVEMIVKYAKEQAKRVEELEEKNRILKLSYDHNTEAGINLMKQNQRYKQALEFYADTKKYQLSAEAERADLTEFINALDRDNGAIARQALEESK